MDIVSHRDYRKFLQLEFSGVGEKRGRRAHLATFLNCQVSYLSQVFTERTHLSLEHALKVAQFLNLSELEKKYFMLLVQKGKAGSHELENFFEQELTLLTDEFGKIEERIGVRNEMDVSDQMTYYSHWYFAALHILSAIPEFASLEKLASHLKLDRGVVKEALDFLERCGLVTKKQQAYSIGSSRIHLPKGSSMLRSHHVNWRLRAMASLDEEERGDLHYSAVLAISESDRKLLRERLLKMLEEFEPVIGGSKEEVPVVLLLDLFLF